MNHTTVNELIAKLSQLPPEDRELPVFGVDGRNGVSHRIGHVFKRDRVAGHDEGDVLDLPPGQAWVELYLGN